MLRSSLCDYSDAYIRVSGTIKFVALAAGAGNNNKKITFKNFAPFTDYISEINNIKVYSAEDIDIVMAMYNLI